MSLVKGPSQSGVATSSASNIQIALPDWDANEISRKLEENTRYLAEWTELLDKNDRTKREDVQPTDMQRHVALKRKLHENLGIMAKMVQHQLKMKKPSDGPSGATPVTTPAGPTPSTANNAFTAAPTSQPSVFGVKQEYVDPVRQVINLS